MDRKKIILGDHIYIVEKYESGDSLVKTKNKFVMLRKYDYMNDMTFDTDVYVIDEDIYRRWKEGKWKLAFPNTYSDVTLLQTTLFSDKIEKFNETFLFNDNELVEILNKDKELAEINCDKIRIYHPHTKVHLDYIIYIDSYINSVHWHFYCSPVSNLPTHSETEICIENVYYSEYVEFFIPNIESLFIDTYYNDSINVIEDYDSSCVPMTLFKTPFKIEEDENRQFYKVYIKKEDKLYCQDSSMFTNNLNVTLFPYLEIDENTNLYLLNENYPPNTTTFITDIKFVLKAEFILDTYPLIVCTFDIPKNTQFTSFIDAYKYYNNVELEEYHGVVYEDTEDSDEEDAELYRDVDGEEMKLCGFQLQIATDTNFKNIIYDETNWDFEFDDFSFQLNGIFDEWGQYPEVLVCRAKFIDRYLGNVITSNQVIITKNEFKYLINPNMRTFIELPNLLEDCPSGFEPQIVPID